MIPFPLLRAEAVRFWGGAGGEGSSLLSRFPSLPTVLWLGDMAYPCGLYLSCHGEAPLVRALRKMKLAEVLACPEGQQKLGGVGSSKQAPMVLGSPWVPTW